MSGTFLYGEEALKALGLSRISSTEWVGRCITCRQIAVFSVADVVENRTTVLRCPDTCPKRARGQQ